ncbi:GtrA family protein [Azoarcus sp. L1K30]|nr:GtrA family protein [Azoarcus sp. L1K30]
MMAHYLVMWIMLQIFAMPLLASAVGFSVGAATRYWMSYFKIFSPEGGVSATLIKFIVAIGLQLLANIALLDILMQAGIELWIAQVIATVSLTILNYLAYRLWVFR